MAAASAAGHSPPWLPVLTSGVRKGWSGLGIAGLILSPSAILTRLRHQC